MNNLQKLLTQSAAEECYHLNMCVLKDWFKASINNSKTEWQCHGREKTGNCCSQLLNTGGSPQLENSALGIHLDMTAITLMLYYIKLLFHMSILQRVKLEKVIVWAIYNFSLKWWHSCIVSLLLCSTHIKTIPVEEFFIF